jgi:hypothetical protein
MMQAIKNSTLKFFSQRDLSHYCGELLMRCFSHETEVFVALRFAEKQRDLRFSPAHRTAQKNFCR